MAILFGIVLAAVLILGWLSGHWWARVLMFIVFAVVGFYLGAVAAGPNPANGLIVGLFGAALGWPVASLPTYYYRRLIKQMLNEPLPDPRTPMPEEWVRRTLGY